MHNIKECLQPSDRNGKKLDLAHWGDITKPFFATIGCSHTYGHSIDYRNSWSSLVAEHFKLEHINISFVGSSIEYQKEKLEILFDKLPQVQFCIWMQSLPTRSHSLDTSKSDVERRIMEGEGSDYKDLKTWEKIISSYNDFKDKNILFTNSWFYNPVYIIFLKSYFMLKKNFYVNTNKVIDFGIDDAHPGPITNKNLSEDLISHIEKNLSHWL